MRKLLFTLLCRGGFHHLFRYFNRRSLTVLLYHGVAPERDHGIYNYKGKHVSPEAFRRHLGYIARHYNVLPLDESFQRLREHTLPRYALAITFDDGYRNFYTHALPLLKEFRMPATIFLVTDFVLQKKPLWVDRLEYAIGQKKVSREERIAEDIRLRAELKMLPTSECERRLEPIERQIGSTLRDFSAERAVYAPLTGSEIKDMQEAGITVGGHTKSHPSLPHLSDAEAAEEIEESKQALEEHFGAISQLFCYPYGRWNEKTEQLVMRAGFTGALTTIEGVNSAGTHPYRLRRFSMDGVEDIGRCAAAISGMRLFLRKVTQAGRWGQTQASTNS
jgi:peptidoglycan/xylan/chitin deacetylase (PgdA/CDA1 family)